jgi:tetratricopeptide (TPR) repeat protein
VLLVAGAAAWSASRPEHAADQTNAALGALADGDKAAALSLAEQAAKTDPLSTDALFALSQIQAAAGRQPAALATLQRAVQLQPANADTWNQLALYDLDSGPGARAALRDVSPALFLNPRSATAQSIYLEAYRREQAAKLKAAAKAKKTTRKR